jgi:exosortase/archaeosortase family protein
MIRSFRLHRIPGPAKPLRQIPGPVKSFLVKAAILFVGWKVVYLVFLLPGRVLDKPLTTGVGKSTAATLAFFNPAADYNAAPGIHPIVAGREGTEPVMMIRSGDTVLLNIADACNGLEVLALYAGLILCLPASPKRKLAYILGGMVGIEVLNVIRCAGLVLVYLHEPEYLNFSHHYLFTLVVYAFIFWLWYLYSRNPNIAKNLQLHVPPTH